jgi:hypothetical protein
MSGLTHGRLFVQANAIRHSSMVGRPFENLQVLQPSNSQSHITARSIDISRSRFDQRGLVRPGTRFGGGSVPGRRSSWLALHRWVAAVLHLDPRGRRPPR